MTSTATVKAHTRRKPEKPAVYIETHAKLRAEVAAMKRVNEFRDEIGYEPGSRPIEILAACSRGLKVLSVKAKELLS